MWTDLEHDVRATFSDLSVWEAPRREVGGYRYGRCWHLSDEDRAAVLQANRSHRDPTEHAQSATRARATRRDRPRPTYTLRTTPPGCTKVRRVARYQTTTEGVSNGR